MFWVIIIKIDREGLWNALKFYEIESRLLNGVQFFFIIIYLYLFLFYFIYFILFYFIFK